MIIKHTFKNGSRVHATDERCTLAPGEVFYILLTPTGDPVYPNFETVCESWDQFKTLLAKTIERESQGLIPQLLPAEEAAQ